MSSTSIQLTRSQAARRIGCCEATLRTIERAGTGPTVIRVSPRRVVYPLDDLERWIAARTVQGASK